MFTIDMIANSEIPSSHFYQKTTIAKYADKKTAKRELTQLLNKWKSNKGYSFTRTYSIVDSQSGKVYFSDIA